MIEIFSGLAVVGIVMALYVGGWYMHDRLTRSL